METVPLVLHTSSVTLASSVSQLPVFLSQKIHFLNYLFLLRSLLALQASSFVRAWERYLWYPILLLLRWLRQSPSFQCFSVSGFTSWTICSCFAVSYLCMHLASYVHENGTSGTQYFFMKTVPLVPGAWKRYLLLQIAPYQGSLSHIQFFVCRLLSLRSLRFLLFFFRNLKMISCLLLVPLLLYLLWLIVVLLRYTILTLLTCVWYLTFIRFCPLPPFLRCIFLCTWGHVLWVSLSSACPQ
jgi:hypothetical protein